MTVHHLLRLQVQAFRSPHATFDCDLALQVHARCGLCRAAGQFVRDVQSLAALVRKAAVSPNFTKARAIDSNGTQVNDEFSLKCEFCGSVISAPAWMAVEDVHDCFRTAADGKFGGAPVLLTVFDCVF